MMGILSFKTGWVPDLVNKILEGNQTKASNSIRTTLSDKGTLIGKLMNKLIFYYCPDHDPLSSELSSAIRREELSF